MLVVQENRVSCGFQSNIKHTHARACKDVSCVLLYVHATHPEVHTCGRVPHRVLQLHTNTHVVVIESIEIIIDARVRVAFRMRMFFSYVWMLAQPEL